MTATMTGLRIGCELLLCGGLLTILVQDWRWRGVYWFLFPLLALLTLASRLLVQPLADVLLDAFLNVAFVVLNLVFIMGYVRVRFKQQSWQRYLGLGDVLFWLCAALACAPLTFVLYFLVSLLITLAVVGTVRWYRGAVLDTVPLAGLQAGCWAAWLVAGWLLPVPPLTSDAWVLTYLLA